MSIRIRPITSKADRKRFVDIAFRLNAKDPNWIPPLRAEALELITPGKNPFYEHAEQQLYIAERGGTPVGRISAHIDHLWLAMPAEQGGGPTIGNWGLLEAVDQEVATTLIATAEEWLRGKGMTSAMAPISCSIWEEPGLLVEGHDHPPTVMMGHQNPKFQPWIERAGYGAVKTLYTYELDITHEFPPLIQRIVAAGEKNSRIRIREASLKHFDREVEIICHILNDAWSDNWGFVPFTPSEIAYTGKKLKPLIKSDLVRIAEYDGEPVAFLMTLPDLNEVQLKANGRKGKPSPLGWLRLGLWLLRPRMRTMRVPLMGVVKRLQASRMASQLAFMMVEYVRRVSISRYGATRGEIGWILDDNQGMNSIAREIQASVNKEYLVYAKEL